MKAYSLDLRSRIVKTYESERISQRALAKRFCVATSFVQKILKQYRETGSLEAKPHGGGTPASLTLEQLMSALEQASDGLSLHDIFNWFSHCCGNVQDFEQVEWQKHPLVINVILNLIQVNNAISHPGRQWFHIQYSSQRLLKRRWNLLHQW